MSVDGLQSALAALDSYWSGRDPTWSQRLPPGLTQREIQNAEAAIHPMVLSDELRVLYTWHDGDGEGISFGDDWPYFMPLSAAIEWWRVGHEELGWTPCWFPIKSYEKQHWIALIDSVRQENSGILNFWFDSNPELYVPSVEAMVRWHLDCLAGGIVGSRSDVSHEVRFEAVEKVRQRHTGSILVRGEPLEDNISSVFTIDWPSAWKEAAGIDEAREIPVGATTTIRELLSGKVSGGIIRGQVIRYGGARYWGIAEIDDGTGRTLVAYPEGTPGGRNLGLGVESELTVKPRVSSLADYLEYAERFMGHVQFVAESIRVVREG